MTSEPALEASSPSFLTQRSKKEEDSVGKLIFELSKLPGIGEKSATRLAYSILKKDDAYVHQLSQAILNAKSKTQFCERCFNFSNEPLCSICRNDRRDITLVCVVEKPSDIHPIEGTNRFEGLYHVLHGVLSPLDGIGPEEIKMKALIKRLEESKDTTQASDPVKEVILALNPTVEGDATALYIAKQVQPLGIRVTKLAHGIPIGGQLEYSDRQTIEVAMNNRVEMSH